MVRTVKAAETLMGRLSRGDDLLEELTALAKGRGVRLGRVAALGAVEHARIGYYDQAAREYRFLELSGELEILALVGNVSLRDGEPMVHAHITLGDDQGRAFGGHLAPGTRVFACEFTLDVFRGEDLVRRHDEPTGLPLWPEHG
ncbi:MAG TPA: PPC domain-containing DNA-binding protein [Deferrisomatales bacterium]|nr:PPC domain-containing DNA-binding protein [Deferrisomatales bacterium]